MQTRAEFAEGIADYVQTHKDYERLSKWEAIIAAVRVLTDDLGAAQSFLYAVGVHDLDLYTYDFQSQPSAVPLASGSDGLGPDQRV